ncbi:MAG: hypothetical protein OXH16_00325 [Gemmatimonadetes bacterium]|nr:hypothetical protein [Gemmatimonadota bacterium]
MAIEVSELSERQAKGKSFDFDEMVYSAEMVRFKPGCDSNSNDAIEAFCREKGIAKWYSKLPGLLESHFPNLESGAFSLEKDDESDDVFVEVLFSVTGDRKEIYEYYDRFLDTWVEDVPAKARAYFQLLLDIAE